MFLFDNQNENKHTTPIFTNAPTMSRLSHSFNDSHWSYPYHVHKHETELIYFSSGKASYQINNEVFSVAAGDLLIVNKGCIHSITSDIDDPISCWTCAITNFKMANSSSPDIFLPLDKKPYDRSQEHRRIIEEIFETLEYFSQQQNPYAVTICNSLANALANIYFSIFQHAVTDHNEKKPSFAQDILFYINENYAKDITLKELTEHFHISSDYISHKFKETYGISPINYVIDRRISEAKWMLINTSDSLISISSQVGYDNTTHFAKLFLKRVGYPPLEYRKRFGMKISSEE